jgi:hypothetical protein
VEQLQCCGKVLQERQRAETARWRDRLEEQQQDVQTDQQQLLVQCVAAVGRERSNSCSLQCCVVTADSQIAVGAEMLCWKGVEMNRCFCYLENQILLSV